eukprot:XP_017948605.1 PREDICTED: uncharacterized protein LOC101731218 [Xenopus tropicalis]
MSANDPPVGPCSTKRGVAMARAPERLSGAQKLQAIVGLLGTLHLMASAVTSNWYNRKGLWQSDPPSEATDATRATIPMTNRQVRGAQLFFIGLSTVMAAAGFCLCLVLLVSWKPPRRSLDTRRTPSPGTLLLAVLLPTGQPTDPYMDDTPPTDGPSQKNCLFFFLGWAAFTWQRWEDIQSQRISLGYSYWLGAPALTMLLFILPIIYIIDECTATEEPKSVPV